MQSFATRVAQDGSGDKIFCCDSGKYYIQVFMEAEGVEDNGPMKTMFSAPETGSRIKYSAICIIISHLYYHQLFSKSAPITISTLPKIKGWNKNNVKPAF